MDSFFSGFQNCRKYLDFEFLLCVRNPFDMLGSVYQQQVKRSGVTLDFLDFLEQQDYLEHNTIQALAVVERLEKLHLKVNVFNYSVVGRSVCSRVLEVMNVHDVASAHIVANEVVNRSLDAAELALILLINSVFGAVAGGRVSDSLVNGLPDIPSVKMACSESAVAIVKSKMQPFVDEINRRLPEDERLSLEPSACHEEAPRSHSLNGDQAVVAYDELVYCFKENLVSSRLKLDGLTPVASLILLFFLGNAGFYQILVDWPLYALILEECRTANCPSGLCETFGPNQLLGYFDYFSNGDSPSFPKYILASQKLNALTHAGLTPAEILDLFAIVHRVKLRAAIG